MTIGPVQMLVLGFDDPQFNGEILQEIQRLREHDVVRLIDALLVNKDEAGEIDIVKMTELDEQEAKEFGAIVGALIGFGAAGEEGAALGAEAGIERAEEGEVLNAEEVWYVADTIPNGTAAAIALIEHRWAIPLRDTIARAGGFPLADEWIHPLDLVAVGVMAAEEAEALKA
jgi:uncharacterized membrane protein